MVHTTFIDHFKMWDMIVFQILYKRGILSDKIIFTYCAEGLLNIALLQQEGVVVANDQPIEVRRGCHLKSVRELETIISNHSTGFKYSKFFLGISVLGDEYSLQELFR